MDVTVRPLREADVEAARLVQVAAFAAHDERMGEPVVADTPERVERRRRRLRHFLANDPGGCWVATDGDRIAGVALASLRDGLWGLSLLVVDPSLHGRGIGRQLLAAALDYGPGAPARRGVIMATRDPGAIRLYAEARFALHPQMRASGAVRSAVVASPRVRDGSPADRGLVEAADCEVRGASRGADHDMLASYADLLVADDAKGSGYAYVHSGEVQTVVATDEATATALLRTALARAADAGLEAVVEHLNANQQWAVQVAVEAGLTLAPSGPGFWREFPPPAAYLPSGPYL